MQFDKIVELNLKFKNHGIQVFKIKMATKIQDGRHYLQFYAK